MNDEELLEALDIQLFHNFYKKWSNEHVQVKIDKKKDQKKGEFFNCDKEYVSFSGANNLGVLDKQDEKKDNHDDKFLTYMFKNEGRQDPFSRLDEKSII